jgi:hypothetical protein
MRGIGGPVGAPGGMNMLRSMLLLALFAAPTLAGDPPASDTSAIRWELPDAFSQARKRAADENRILLIKGVSFGIDKVGATCATKGMW